MPLTWQAQPLTMDWCLDCHRNPEMHVRPRDRVFDMDYQPPAESGRTGPATGEGIRHSPPDKLFHMPPMTNSDSSFVPVDALQRGEVAHSDDASRRRFLEIMGASLAMAAAAGCTRQPTEFIVPYVEPPEDAIPGRPSYYATARMVQGLAQGVVVESHLGRPTKVEGNPGHPASLGATDVHGQSCVLDLYDPDRSKQITESGEPREWDAFLLALGKALEPLGKTGGEGLYMLSEPSTSPTLGAQRSAVMKAFPNARWHQYDASGPDNARAGASSASDGRSTLTIASIAQT